MAGLSLAVLIVSPPRFPLGRIVATRSVLVTVPNEDIQVALARHAKGDWGTLDAEDRSANERALQFGGRLFSVYHSTENITFWIITEADRSLTTVLLPEDY